MVFASFTFQIQIYLLIRRGVSPWVPERTIYISNKTWTSSKIGPEDDHRSSKHVAPVY